MINSNSIKTKATYIYIFDDGNGNYKVGISANPALRLKQCQTGNPSPLMLYAVSEPMSRSKAMSIERGVHRGLKSLNTSGEWFRINDSKLLETVKREIRAVACLA